MLVQVENMKLVSRKRTSPTFVSIQTVKICTSILCVFVAKTSPVGVCFAIIHSVCAPDKVCSIIFSHLTIKWFWENMTSSLSMGM